MLSIHKESISENEKDFIEAVIDEFAKNPRRLLFISNK